MSEIKMIVASETETQTAVSTIINIPTEEVFKAYKYRFVILTVYSILSAVFGILISVTSPLITTLQNIYNVDIFMVTLCVSLISFIVFVPVGFLANYILDRYGLRVGLLFGCAFLLIGIWINVLSEHGFYILFIGNFIMAVGQPFIANAPQMVSSTWFLPQERAISTSVASMSNLIGAAIGYLISSCFVADDASGETGLKQFHKLMLFSAIIGTVAVVLVVLFFRDHPPTPPSKGAELSKLTTSQSLKSLSKNWNYIIFTLSASLFWGSLNFFASMAEPLVYAFGYSVRQAGIFVAISLGSGVVGSLVWAGYVDKSKKFKCSVIICSLLTIVFTILIGVGLFVQKFAVIAVAVGAMGFFALPILSLTFELCAEISFPVAEGTSGGLFVLTANLVAVFGMLSADAIMKSETKAHTLDVFLMIIGIQLVSFSGFVVFKENLRRLNAEKEGQVEGSNSSSEEKSDEENKKYQAYLSNSHYVFPQEILAHANIRSLSSHM